MLNLPYAKCGISHPHCVKNFESRESSCRNQISMWNSNRHLLEHDAEGKATFGLKNIVTLAYQYFAGLEKRGAGCGASKITAEATG